MPNVPGVIWQGNSSNLAGADRGMVAQGDWEGLVNQTGANVTLNVTSSVNASGTGSTQVDSTFPQFTLTPYIEFTY